MRIDLKTAMAPGLSAAARVSARLRQHVTRAFRRGDEIDVWSILQELQGPLAETLAVSHVIGEIRATSMWDKRRKRSELRFSFHDVLAARADVDFEALDALYDTRAFTVLQFESTSMEREIQEFLLELERDPVPVRTGMRLLQEKLESMGIGTTRHRAEAMFRTHSQVTYQAGRFNGFRDPDVEDLIWGFMYTTVGDDRVRDEHAALDGVRHAKDDLFWTKFWPPNGWNCRCSTIPILTSDRIASVKPALVRVEPHPDFNFNPGEVFNVRATAKPTVFKPTSKDPWINEQQRREFEATGRLGRPKRGRSQT